MTADALAQTGVHPLTGFLSSLGILMWWTSASIWLFTAHVAKQRDGNASIGFELYSGLLSLYLALDDQFQFHETLAKRYLGLPEEFIYPLIAGAVGLYVWKYADVFRKPAGIFLGIALFFLAGSVFVDGVVEPVLVRLVGRWEYLFEDGLKWLGICFWVAFCLTWCKRMLARDDPADGVGNQASAVPQGQ